MGAVDAATDAIEGLLGPENRDRPPLVWGKGREMACFPLGGPTLDEPLSSGQSSEGGRTFLRAVRLRFTVSGKP
jgi:hypothetical protein